MDDESDARADLSMADIPNSQRPGPGMDQRIHLEKALSVIPYPYYWSWSIFGALCALVSIAVLILSQGTSCPFIWVFLVLSALTAMQSIGVIWAQRRMRLFRETFIHLVEWPEERAKREYERQTAKIFDDVRMAASGIAAVALAHLISADYFGFGFHEYPSIAFHAVYYLAVYTLGAGLYVLVMTALAVHKIGELPLPASVLFSKDMHAIGILYSKFTAYASGVYIIWVIFQIQTPHQLTLFDRSILSLLFAGVLMAYFILPQQSIHHLMLTTKQKKIEAFSSHLSAVVDLALINPTYERLVSLNDLLHIQRQLDRMSEWPFSFYELLHIVLITIIPLMVLTLEVIHGMIYE